MRKIILSCLTLSLALAPFQAVAAQIGESIIVVSREAGSGTRAAFAELAGVVDEHGDDAITVEADVLNTTGGVMQVVAGNKAAIGYISLGSVNHTVKALSLDGVTISAQAVRDGSYPLARPFNLAWKRDGLTPIASDFLRFVYSQEGQELVEQNGFIAMGEATKWQGQVAGSYPYEVTEEESGTLSIVGSTSLTPIIEKLAERYQRLQPNVRVNVTSNGSTAGLTAALDGTADLGMASRALSKSEQSKLNATAFALDGIVAVVNPAQTMTDISLAQLRRIYTGDQTKW